MKKLIIIIILFSTCLITGQSKKKDYLVPSFYSTAGDYDNGNSSISYSGYLLFTVKKFNHIVLGFDNLTITQPSFDYSQQMFVAGEYLNFFPWIISGHFAYVGGGYSSNGETYPDSEFMNIYNINVKHNINLFYIGASYTFSNIRGSENLNVHQAGIIFDYYLSNNFSLHMHTFYSHMKGKKDVKSGTLIVNVKPVKSWLLSLHKTMGDKLYFFDPEQLTLFNQPETVQGSFGMKTVLSFVKELDLIFSYNQYDFGSYMINYYSGGVKFNIAI